MVTETQPLPEQFIPFLPHAESFTMKLKSGVKGRKRSSPCPF